MKRDIFSYLFGSFLLLFIISLLILMALSIAEYINFEHLFRLNKQEWHLINFTFIQALLSTLFSLLLGVLLAWSLANRGDFPLKGVLISFISSSLVLPTIIVAFGIIAIFGREGFLQTIGIDIGNIYGLKGILIAHIYLNSSYATKVLFDRLSLIPLQQYKLSATLGFSAWQKFYYIEFEAIKSTLYSLAVTIFLLCFSSFAIILLLGGGPSNNTLEVAIYEAVKIDFDLSKAIKYASIQLLFALFITLLFSKHNTFVNDLAKNSFDISFASNSTQKLLQYLIITAFALFFLSPLFVIIVDGLDSNLMQIVSDKLFRKSLIFSLFIAFISALFTLLFSFFIADMRRVLKLKSLDTAPLIFKVIDIFISIISNIYLIISSLILGVGFFLISLRFSIDLQDMGLFALIVSNILLSLPFALSILFPLMLGIEKRYHKLTLSLGLSYFQKLRYVDLGYLKKSLIYIFTLSFCFSLGDLGIIALFGNENFSTLPWYLYSLLGTYQNQSAAGVAMIMLLLTLSIFLLGERFAKSR